MMSEVFWTFLITSTIGFCLGVIRLCYKSKCKEIKCCGCIKIIRDVETEQQEMEFQLRNLQKTQSKETFTVI